MGIPLCALVFFATQEQRSFAPLYFASKPEYHQFLEDLEKGGQAKARAARFFSFQQRDHQWYLKDSLALSQLLALRMDPRLWTEDKIRDLAQYVLILSYRHNLPPALVLSLIEVESRYRADAVSSKGAVGLMQVKPSTAAETALRYGIEWEGAHSLRDPKKNIELGLLYLVDLRQRFRKPELVLTAYNIGPNALERMLKSGEKPPLRYYQKVMRAMASYRDQAKAPVTAAAHWTQRWL